MRNADNLTLDQAAKRSVDIESPADVVAEIGSAPLHPFSALCERGAEAAAGIPRFRHDPYVVEPAFSRQHSVEDAIERNAAGIDQILAR